MRYAEFQHRMEIHPDVLWIAVNIILHPEHRSRYSPLVLLLADEAIEKIRMRLLQSQHNNEEIINNGMNH